MKKKEIEKLKKIKKKLSKKELEVKRLKDMYPEINAYNDAGLDAYALPNAYNDAGLDAYALPKESLYKELKVCRKR